MPQNDGPSPIGDKTQVVQSAPQGLEWSTLAAQLGWTPPPQSAMLPDRHTDQAQPAPLPGKQLEQTDGHGDQRLPVSLAVSKSSNSPDQFLYDVGRVGAYSGVGMLSQMSGSLDLGFAKHGPVTGLAFGAGIAVADTVIDRKFFGDTPRGVPSVVADAGALAIMYTPQPPAFKAAEMIGLHVLGKYGDKWFG